VFETPLRGKGTTHTDVSFRQASVLHESRPLEMWATSFCNDNPEVHNAAFKLLKTGTSSSCEHGAEPLGYMTGA
jgi:hypothetical protein